MKEKCNRCGKRVKTHTQDQCIRYLKKCLDKLRADFNYLNSRVSNNGPIDPTTGDNIF